MVSDLCREAFIKWYCENISPHFEGETQGQYHPFHAIFGKDAWEAYQAGQQSRTPDPLIAWLPIETAPKEPIICCNDGDEVEGLWWRRDKYVSMNNNYGDNLTLYFTHWMKWPDLPKTLLAKLPAAGEL